MADTLNDLEVATAILASVDSGQPLRTCGELADELKKIVGLFREAGREEEAQKREWEYHVCSLRTRMTVILSENSERFAGILIREDGTQIPDPDALDNEQIDYIANRVPQIVNKVLKARYADFVWEKSRLKNKRDFATTAIDAYLETVHDFADSTDSLHQVELLRGFDHATYLALKIGAQDRIKRIVSQVLALLKGQRTTGDEEADAPTLPDRYITDLAHLLFHIRSSKRFSGEVTDSDLKALQSILEDIANAQFVQSMYPASQEFLKAATQAAMLRQDQAASHDLKIRYIEMLEREAEERSGEGSGVGYLVAAGIYQTIQNFLSKMISGSDVLVEQRADLQRREALVKIKIREMYRQGRGEIKPVLVPIEVDKEDYEAMLAYFLEPATLDECLYRIASDSSLLPNVEQARQLATEATQNGTLLSIIPKNVLSDDIPIAEARTEKELRELETDRNLLMWVVMNSSIVLSELFIRLCELKAFSAEHLCEYFSQWGLMDEDNLEFLKTGIERYFTADYVSALHILVPQFEDTLRTAFEKMGLSVIKPRKGEHGWEFETFGNLLKRIEKETPAGTLSTDLSEYIRIVFSAQTGWNLRNRVAHGLIQPQLCTRAVLNTVIHLYLILTQFHVQNASL